MTGHLDWEALCRETLRFTYTQQGVEIWMHARNHWLSNEVPIELIRQGRGAKVWAAVERIEGGL